MAARTKTIDIDNPYDLNEKQQLFCQYYVKNFNEVQSYIKAYNCTYINACRCASRLMQENAGIKKEIKRLKKILNKDILVDAKDVLKLIIRIAFSDIGNYIEFGHMESKKIDSDGNTFIDDNGEEIKYIHNYTRIKDNKYVDTQLIQEISQGKEGIKIKLADKKYAIEWLIKYFDIIPDDLKNKIDEEKLKKLQYENKANDEENIKEVTEEQKEVYKSKLREKLFLQAKKYYIEYNKKYTKKSDNAIMNEVLNELNKIDFDNFISIDNAKIIIKLIYPFLKLKKHKKDFDNLFKVKRINEKNVKDFGNNFYHEIAPRTKWELAIYSIIVLDVRLTYPAICKCHCSQLDFIWDGYAELEDFMLLQAVRGGGKTLIDAALSFIQSLFKVNCGISVLGGSLEQSTRCVNYLNQFWDISEIDNKLLVKGQVSGRGFKLENKSWVSALAASTKSTRGPHPSKLLIDEVDELEKKVYDAALGQPKAKDNIKDTVIATSTLHNPFGLFSEIIDNREEKGAKLYQYCIEEVREPYGFYSDKEIERRKRQIPKAMWDCEYLLKRPKIGDTIFDFESVDKSYRRGMKDKYNKKIYTEVGLDWGYAVTALSIIQDDKEKFTNPITKTFEYVELTDRCKEIADICIEYNIKIIYADSNPKDSNITLKKILKEKRCQTELITIAFNKWKDVGINVIRLLLEKDRLNITDKTAQEKMKKYHYKNPEQGIIAKEDDHICDSFIAWGSSRHKLLI
jgi:phage terminase small subunit